MTHCNRTDAHSLGECPDYTEPEPGKACPTCSAGPKYGPLPEATPHASWCPRRPVYPVVGAYVEVEQRSRLGVQRAVVLVTSTEARADERGREYTYVGWRNAQPGGGWDRTMGWWGFFRLYTGESRPEYGTRLLRLVPA